MKYLELVLTVPLSTALIACGGRPAAESPAPSPSAPAASAMPTAPPPGPATATPPVGATGTSSEYDIRGMITEVAADRRSVTLDHEAIPGLMPAMKMEYRVSRANVLKGLAAGDRVHGRLQVKGTDYVVTSLARP